MSKILNIITHPNENLRRVSSKVDFAKENSPEFQNYLNDLVLTMQEKDGIGLAAPQVDDARRILIVNAKEGPLVLINPVVTHKSFRKNKMEEGCLSVPGVNGIVKRPFSIKLNALTRDGKKYSQKTCGLLARVIQHEIDHLNGILFIDKVVK